MKKKNKKSIYLVIFVAIIFIALYIVETTLPLNAPNSFVINNKTYAITAYAYTTAQQEKGLMNASVTNKTFMLFSFSQSGIYIFWMKNTYTPLDIMWVEYNSSTSSGKIVYIANAIPCSDYSRSQDNCTLYNPNAYANYVIETKAGFAQANNITNGTKIKFLHR